MPPHVMRWKRASPMVLVGCAINEKSAIGVARSQRMTPPSAKLAPVSGALPAVRDLVGYTFNGSMAGLLVLSPVPVFV